MSNKKMNFTGVGNSPTKLNFQHGNGKNNNAPREVASPREVKLQKCKEDIYKRDNFVGEEKGAKIPIKHKYT